MQAVSKPSEPSAAATQAPPFLLTTRQGWAARTLLAYVAALPLSSPDAQVLAVIVAVRAARGGTGNISGADMRSLKLTDPAQAVVALRGLGWEIPDPLLDLALDTPVRLTVPDLLDETGHPLPFGKQMRSRVSGWAMRTLAAKPVRKAPPATRLGALFLAAHGSSELDSTVPDDLPAACHDALPALLDGGFLADLSGEHYRLGIAVRHLGGLFPEPDEADGAAQRESPRRIPKPREVGADEWASWKADATPALRRHAEAVEGCAVCRLAVGRVASAFADTRFPVPAPRHVSEAHDAWRQQHPDCGAEAARFTVAFRAEHGHGPSYGQLCKKLGWRLPRSLRTFLVLRLLDEQWLADTAPVPWTLRPGRTAQAQGIVLPDRAPQGVTAAHRKS
jgi:hypothetical protein